jgi:Cyclic nucleotide-binding domain.
MEEIVWIYLSSVKKLCPNISETELSYLAKGLTITELKAKHFYIQANIVQEQIGFVCSGLVRAFYIDKNGNDVTVNFVGEGNYATHYPAFIMKRPSKYYFQCLEPSVIVNLSYSHIQDCCEKFPTIEHYIRLLVEEAFTIQQKRIDGFLFDNAETRYLDFIKEYPDLFNRVSLSYLCSYLGIERQSLTRIRKKLVQKS